MRGKLSLRRKPSVVSDTRGGSDTSRAGWSPLLTSGVRTTVATAVTAAADSNGSSSPSPSPAPLPVYPLRQSCLQPVSALSPPRSPFEPSPVGCLADTTNANRTATSDEENHVVHTSSASSIVVCPVCSLDLKPVAGDKAREDHVNACLDRRRDVSQTPGTPSKPLTPSARCEICAIDLRLLRDDDERAQHLAACYASADNTPAGAARPGTEAPLCPLCDTRLNDLDRRARAAHIKRCGLAHNVSTTRLVGILRQIEQEAARMLVQTTLTPVRSSPGATRVASSGASGKRPRRGSRVPDESLQVGMALSASLVDRHGRTSEQRRLEVAAGVDRTTSVTLSTATVTTDTIGCNEARGGGRGRWRSAVASSSSSTRGVSARGRISTRRSAAGGRDRTPPPLLTRTPSELDRKVQIRAAAALESSVVKVRRSNSDNDDDELQTPPMPPSRLDYTTPHRRADENGCSDMSLWTLAAQQPDGPQQFYVTGLLPTFERELCPERQEIQCIFEEETRVARELLAATVAEAHQTFANTMRRLERERNERLLHAANEGERAANEDEGGEGEKEEDAEKTPTAIRVDSCGSSSSLSASVEVVEGKRETVEGVERRAWLEEEDDEASRDLFETRRTTLVESSDKENDQERMEPTVAVSDDDEAVGGVTECNEDGYKPDEDDDDDDDDLMLACGAVVTGGCEEGGDVLQPYYQVETMEEMMMMQRGIDDNDDDDIDDNDEVELMDEGRGQKRTAAEAVDDDDDDCDKEEEEEEEEEGERDVDGFGRMTTPELTIRLRKFGMRTMRGGRKVMVAKLIELSAYARASQRELAREQSAHEAEHRHFASIFGGRGGGGGGGGGGTQGEDNMASQSSVASSMCGDSDAMSDGVADDLLEMGSEDEDVGGVESDGVDDAGALLSKEERMTRRLAMAVRQCDELYEKILMYQPLELRDIQRVLKERAGVRCGLVALADFLDDQGINYRAATAGVSRQKRTKTTTAKGRKIAKKKT